jgi:hypothetical protein
MTDTLAIRILDREVVLLAVPDSVDTYESADKVIWLAKYKSGLWAIRFHLNGSNAYGWGGEPDIAVTDLDSKLRELREWLR